MDIELFFILFKNILFHSFEKFNQKPTNDFLSRNSNNIKMLFSKNIVIELFYS